MSKREAALDPEHFGWQLNSSYIPDPEEIAQQCEELRKLWSSRETRSRARWAQSIHCTTPEVGESDMRRRK